MSTPFTKSADVLTSASGKPIAMDTKIPAPPPARRLVTVRRIDNKERMKGSGLDLVHVGGWTVVVPKNHYQVGQLVLYFEIDSFLPAADGRFWEYVAGRQDIFDGTEGFRVRSRTFGKKISQGIVFPIEQFPEVTGLLDDMISVIGEPEAMKELFNLSFETELRVKKWEAVVDKNPNANLGKPPSFFPQPCSERAQNVVGLFSLQFPEPVFQITEKLDGVSMTIYTVDSSSRWYRCLPALPEGCSEIMDDGQRRIGVCGRAHDFVDNGENKYWQVTKMLGLHEKVHQIGGNVALQGEFCGWTVGQNTMEFPKDEHTFLVFGIWDIDKQQHVPVKTVVDICKRLDIAHVPVLGYYKIKDFANNLEELLEKAKGVGMNGNIREGFVIKYLNGRGRCKVISNDWLIKTGT